jgi:apolipoprotein N-acyltransferase
MTGPVSLKLSTPVRVALGLLLALAGGIAFVLAFPPYEIWPLIFIGWVLVLFAQFRLMPARLSSLASAVGVFAWLEGYLGPIFAPVGSFMVWLPLIVAAITLLADAGLRLFHQKTAYRWFVASGVASWASIELIRLFIPIAGTWAFIATPLYRQTWLIQPVSIFGIIGLGALIYFINLALTLLLMGWFDRRWKLDETVVAVQDGLWKRWGIAAGAALAAWIALSLVLLRPMDTPPCAWRYQPALSPIINANRATMNWWRSCTPAWSSKLARPPRSAQLIIWRKAVLVGSAGG